MKQPIRVFEGSTQPHEAFWRFVNADESQSGEVELEFYGYISEYSWYEDDITPKMFKDQLYANGKGGPVTVRLNSGGGEIFAASVIRSTLLDYPGKVTVKIDGLAASAAVMVALSGDEIQIQESAYMMIHDPAVGFMFAYLNIEDMEQYLEELKTLKNGMVDVYASQTGMDKTVLAKMMAEETWMTANEAKDYGFVHSVIQQSKKKEPSNPKNKTAVSAVYLNALSLYHNVPETLLNLLPERDKPQQEETNEVKRLRAECQLYSRKEK